MDFEFDVPGAVGLFLSFDHRYHWRLLDKFRMGLGGSLIIEIPALRL
jgi:hypothetical protein